MCFFPRFKLSLAAITLSLITAPIVIQAEECTVRNSSNAAGIANSVAENCCSRSGRRARNRCFNRAGNKIKALRDIITPKVVRTSSRAIRAVRNTSCDMTALGDQVCTADTSTTIAEAAANIEESSCSARVQQRRLNNLRANRRAVNGAERYLSAAYVDGLKSEINNLAKSRTCGAGGEQQSNSCRRVVNPRDGFKSGNVYKLGDYTGTPVFITHNGARSGRAITNGGKTIERLSYTGTANPDNLGPRHHYRMSTSCRSLPSSYLIEIGSTCYEINDPCGRID